MDLRALAKSSALYSVGNVASRAAGFLMIPVYTRFLTTADYGVIELLELAIFVAVTGFGIDAIGEAMTRIYHERAGKAPKLQVISTTCLTTLGLTAIVAVLGLAVSGPLSSLIFGDASRTGLLRAAFLAMATGGVMEVCRTYLRIMDRALHFVVFSLVFLVLSLGLNIWLIAFEGQGVWGFVISKLVSTGLGAAYLMVVTLREVRFTFDRAALRSMVTFGRPLIAVSVAMFVIHFSDRFFVQHYADLDSVGVYALAYKFGFLITYLVGEPFGRAWYARLFAHTDEPGWMERFSSVFCALAFCLMFLWTGLSLLVHDGLVVLARNEAFLPAAAFVPAIALGYVAREAGDFFRHMLYINKRSGLVARLSFVCAAINVALNFALVPRYGVWGAAVSTLLTWIAWLAFTASLAQREHPLPLPLGRLALLVALGLGLVGLGHVMSLEATAARWILNGTLALAYPVLAWWLGGITASHKRLAREGLAALRARWGRR